MQLEYGNFISIEGIEGVGKSTAIKFLQQYLTSQGVQFVLTREPGGTPIAESIRQVLLGHYDEVMSPDTELMLMFAGRAQNIAEVIRPALDKGYWVLSDRFTDASFAYQGGGRGIDARHIEELAKWVQKELRPNLTILLDAPVEIGLTRVASRGAKDRIEAEGSQFFERVRQTYLNLAREQSDRFRVIDATQDLKSIEKQLLQLVQPMVESIT